jgi:dicarboxylate transporter 10
MAAFEQKYQNGVARIVEYPVWFGGSASSMAVCVTHPLELGTCNSVIRGAKKPSESDQF